MAVQKIKDKFSHLSSVMGEVIHPKSFVLSFLMLFLISVAMIFSMAGTDGGHHASVTPTGKIIAHIQIAPEETVQPEETSLPPPPPPPSEETSDSHTQMTVQPLESIDKPEATEDPAIEDAIAGLSEETSFGSLPIIRKTDRMTVYDAYKAPFTLKPDTRAVISLVMVDYGLSDVTSKNALEKLPEFTSFVASPYSSNLQAKINAARGKHMEMWMNIPIEGTEFTKDDTGPSSVLSTLNAKSNISRLNTNLGRGTGYAGVVFENTPNFKAQSPEFEAVIKEISSRGLGLIQLDATDTITSTTAATQPKMPFSLNDMWIDGQMNKTDILHALSNATSKSLEKSSLIVAFHPTPAVISAIAEWKETLDKNHVQLAPLTTAIHQKSLIKK